MVIAGMNPGIASCAIMSEERSLAMDWITPPAW
jgi:hypothetical protein